MEILTSLNLKSRDTIPDNTENERSQDVQLHKTREQKRIYWYHRETKLEVLTINITTKYNITEIKNGTSWGKSVVPDNKTRNLENDIEEIFRKNDVEFLYDEL